MKRRDLDRDGLNELGDLAQRGASSAADALADLIGGRVLRCAPSFHLPEHYRGRQEWETGVFCEVDGAFAGAAAVFLSEAGKRRVLEALCASGAPTREFAASVLSEFGNMLSSRAVSAMGDGLGVLLLPGLPELATTGAASLFPERLGARETTAQTLCVESELFEEESGLRALIVLAFHEPSKLVLKGYAGAVS